MDRQNDWHLVDTISNNCFGVCVIRTKTHLGQITGVGSIVITLLPVKMEKWKTLTLKCG